MGFIIPNEELKPGQFSDVLRNTAQFIIPNEELKLVDNGHLDTCINNL